MKKLMFLMAGFALFGCGDEEDAKQRYVEDVFETVTVTSSVKYGANAQLIGHSKDLLMDIYEPEGDGHAQRPAIVLAHGGAFILGHRSDLDELCEAYAKKGYVAVTIDYRLINDVFIDTDTAFSEGVVLAIGDMKAAIRYLRDNALNDNEYGIDPDRIFAGGVSAGAVIANHVGYLDDGEVMPTYLREHLDNHGGIEGNTNDIGASSSVSGVVSFSGSLFDKNWMDVNDPPLFAVHEEFDPIVPCGFDASDAFPFEIFGYGGCSLSEQATEVGLLHEFIFLEGSNEHVNYLGEETATAMINSSAEFLAAVISSL